MIEIWPGQFETLGALAAPMAAIHGSIAAVLGGTAAGEVWVDAVDAPTVALLVGPEGTYLIGARLVPTVAAAVAELLDDWVYLHVDPRIAGEVAAALPNPFMVAHPRLMFCLAPPAGVDVVPAGLELMTDADGIGQTLLQGGLEIGHCRPDLRVGNRSEIGVWVHPAHRRQGLASILVARALQAAHTAGIADIGWHCHASNYGSAAIARRFAKGAPVETLAYSASLPAENAGDLSPTQCRDLALHFEAGTDEIAWLWFHAACAWAMVPDNKRALSAVERLVASRWQGEPDWLAGHWALEGVCEMPRFAAAIATLKKQKAPPG